MANMKISLDSSETEIKLNNLIMLANEASGALHRVNNIDTSGKLNQVINKLCDLINSKLDSDNQKDLDDANLLANTLADLVRSKHDYDNEKLNKPLWMLKA